VYGFSGITGAILLAGFHWDNKLFKGIELKKNKKLTEIGFYWFFLDWETVLFNGFGFVINVC
jgi:hypothetical protein